VASQQSAVSDLTYRGVISGAGAGEELCSDTPSSDSNNSNTSTEITKLSDNNHGTELGKEASRISEVLQ